MNKLTIRFYTDTNRYMGWVYLNKTVYHNQVINWLRSGNSIKMGNKTYNIDSIKAYTN